MPFKFSSVAEFELIRIEVTSNPELQFEFECKKVEFK